MGRMVKILVAFVVLGLCGHALASDANLVAHWQFDEGSGTTAYDSAGSNHGTIHNANWTTGQVGGALSFDGSGDYVEVPHDDSLNLVSAGTVAAWVKLNGSYRQGIVAKHPSTSSGNYFFITSTGSHMGIGISSGSWSGGTIWVNTPEEAIANEWAFYAGTFDSDRVNLYENGVLVNSSANTITPVTTGAPLYIGKWPNSSSWDCDGSIDEVMIFNRALSAEEVQHLYWEAFGDLELAIMQVEEALAEKEAALEGIDAALEKELVALGAIEDLVESKDYGDLRKSDIIKARQGIHSAMQHQEQSASALERGIEQLGDALEALGVEAESEIVYEVLPCDMNSAQPESFSDTRFSVTVKGSYIYFEDMVTANCCADAVELEMEVENYAITLYETEETPNPCWCVCPYPVSAVLGPFAAGTYTVEVYEDYGGFIGSATVTIGPGKGKKEATGLLKVVAASKPKT